jgi:phosphate uptake regulator
MVKHLAENREVRKIQFTGRSTFILSLPKNWMKEMQLKAGDLVSVVREANNSLSIIPNDMRALSSTLEAITIVSDRENTNSLKRKVISIYLSGYNTIHLRSKTGRINPAQRDAVREVVRRNLVGTEIIADSSDVITIQVLLTLPELSVNTAVRRMFLLASSMHKDAMLSLAESNHELANAVVKSDDEVDRFSLYILRNLVIATQNERVLREIGLRGPADCLSYRVAVKSIERIADHSSGIADKSLKIEQKISTKDLFQKIEKMSQLSLGVVSDAVEAFLRRDYVMADSVVDKVENIRSVENDIISHMDRAKTSSANSSNSSSSSSTAANNIHIKLILEDIRRTAEHASDIAEAAMNQTIEEVIEKRTPPPSSSSAFTEENKFLSVMS